MVRRTPKKSAGEERGLKLLQSVREMKAGQAARVTEIEPNEVAPARQMAGLSQTEFAGALGISTRVKSGSEVGALHRALRKR